MSRWLGGSVHSKLRTEEAEVKLATRFGLPNTSRWGVECYRAWWIRTAVGIPAAHTYYRPVFHRRSAECARIPDSRTGCA